MVQLHLPLISKPVRRTQKIKEQYGLPPPSASKIRDLIAERRLAAMMDAPTPMVMATQTGYFETMRLSAKICCRIPQRHRKERDDYLRPSRQTW